MRGIRNLPQDDGEDAYAFLRSFFVAHDSCTIALMEEMPPAGGPSQPQTVPPNPQPNQFDQQPALAVLPSESTDATQVSANGDQSPYAASNELPAASSVEPVSWTASEFVVHQKSFGWYVLLILGTIVLAVLAYIFTKGFISSIVVIVGAGVLVSYGARQPHQLAYLLDQSGLQIGERHYAYDAFRSFAVVPEGAFSSIIFLPLKRFAPLTTIYYAPEDESRILGLLSAVLPMEEYRHDAIDQLMRRIRF
jgi:hypothetical protein